MIRAVVAAIWRAIGRPYPLVITSDRRLSPEAMHAIQAKLELALGDTRGQVIVLSKPLSVVRVYTFRWLLAANLLGAIVGLVVGWLFL